MVWQSLISSNSKGWILIIESLQGMPVDSHNRMKISTEELED